MSRMFHSLAMSGLIGLSLVAWKCPSAKAGDDSSARAQFSTPGTAAQSAASPLANATVNADSAADRSFLTATGVNRNYYYYPGYGGCYYYYAPAPSPAATGRQAAPNATAASVTAANPGTVTYRSYAPDAGANSTYSSTNLAAPSYSYGNYTYGNYSYSSSGHSWGSRR